MLSLAGASAPFGGAAGRLLPETRPAFYESAPIYATRGTGARPPNSRLAGRWLKSLPAGGTGDAAARCRGPRAGPPRLHALRGLLLLRGPADRGAPGALGGALGLSCSAGPRSSRSPRSAAI